MNTIRNATFAAVLMVPSAAMAGPAADLVAVFYGEGVGYEADLSMRDHFTYPALAQFDGNDEAAATGDMGCIDFGLAVDGQDFDEAEIAGTLELEEDVEGDEAVVIARFTNFGEPRAIEWRLERVDGAWKISDIAHPHAGWRLSEFDCGA